jgi:hypothetical protein
VLPQPIPSCCCVIELQYPKTPRKIPFSDCILNCPQLQGFEDNLKPACIYRSRKQAHTLKVFLYKVSHLLSWQARHLSSPHVFGACSTEMKQLLKPQGFSLASAAYPRGTNVTFLRFLTFPYALIRHWNFSGRIF